MAAPPPRALATVIQKPTTQLRKGVRKEEGATNPYGDEELPQWDIADEIRTPLPPPPMSSEVTSPDGAAITNDKPSEREPDTSCPVCSRPWNECKEGFQYLPECLHGICNQCYRKWSTTKGNAVSCPTCRTAVEEMPAICSVCADDVGSCGMVHRCGMVVCAACFIWTRADGATQFTCPKCKDRLDCGIQKLIDPHAADRVIMDMRVLFKDDDEDTSYDARFVLCAQFELLLYRSTFALRATSPECSIVGEDRGSFTTGRSKVDFFVTSVRFKIPEPVGCKDPYTEECYFETFNFDDKCRCWWIRHTRDSGVARDGYLTLPLRIDFIHTATERPMRDSLLEDGIRFSCPMNYRPWLRDVVSVVFQDGADPPRGTSARIKRRRVASDS